MFDENYTPPPTPASSFTFSYRSANHTASIRRFVGSETEVVIPSTVEYNGATYKVTAIADGNIGTGAFYNSNITSVVIPDTVTSIGNYAFSGCDNLAMVNFGENSQLTSIGDGAFEGCSRLTSITIPSRVTSISFAAFHSCSSLTSITIGEGVISIGNDAFGDCYALAEVYNYSSLTITAGSSLNDGYLGQYAKVVYNASDLTGEKPETRIKDNNGVRYYDDGENTVVALYPLSRNVTTVSFDSRTTEIQPGAFNGCSSLTSITIPSSVTSIGERVFYNCSGLTSITIPDSVTSIGTYAFNGCSSLNEVTVESDNIYLALTSQSACGRLINYITSTGETVKVLKSVVDSVDPSFTVNTYLNGSNFERSEEGDYYVYTHI